VADIDIYPTDRDRAAYNHGLFWHTFHYVPAGRSTHRSYPRHPKVMGGGPANEHNYATGLRLHWLLAGDPESRDAAIGLARWVVAMDDGRQTVLRWIDAGPTGHASATQSPIYHGPGRGAGHSIMALLDGHRLTGEGPLLAKAEELIRRCIHPHDDIGARELLDAERRWSYVVFLQALGRYLEHKGERGEIDGPYAYARAALLHYARWMAEHEYPYLEKPEILEYPTETWGPDIRKSDVSRMRRSTRPATTGRASRSGPGSFSTRGVHANGPGRDRRETDRPALRTASCTWPAMRSRRRRRGDRPRLRHRDSFRAAKKRRSGGPERGRHLAVIVVVLLAA
jgi:hypothetical protein